MLQAYTGTATPALEPCVNVGTKSVRLDNARDVLKLIAAMAGDGVMGPLGENAPA